MNVRRQINSLLRNFRYEVVKVADPAAAQGQITKLPAEALLDDSFFLSRISPQRKHAWIVAAPKSGSTWLSALLENLLGWRTLPLLSGFGRREQELDVRQMVRFPTENVFSPHQHCRASEATLAFIKQFRVKPIVQVRNFHDTIISFRDHLLQEGVTVPMAYIDSEFLQLDEERQLGFIIDLLAPWYFNFYASWFQVKDLPPESLMFVDYDQLRENPAAILTAILAYLGETRTPAQIAAALEAVKAQNTRKNKATPGRGQLLLNDRHKARILQLRQYYPHIDFSRVGL